MLCPYCDRKGTLDETCRGCGFTLELPKWQKSEPFEYRGYIVWSLRCLDRHALEFCFFQGRQLVGKQFISIMEMRSAPEYDEGVDMMPWVFDKWMNSKEKEKEQDNA